MAKRTPPKRDEDGKPLPTPEAEGNKHHWVPQFYLKAWAENGQLLTKNLGTGRPFKEAVSQTAMVRGFYAVPENVADPEVFEKLFSKLEGQAAAVRDVVEKGTWPLTAEDRDILGIFVTLQVLRGPEQRRLMVKLQTNRVAREKATVADIGAAAWFEERFGVRPDDEQAERVWWKATGSKELPIPIDARYHIEQIARLAERALPYVLSRRWTLIRFDEPALITSDTPVSLSGPGEGKPGLLTARELTYPLSRRTSLILGEHVPGTAPVKVRAVRGGRFDREKKGGPDKQRLMNERTVYNAHEAVYSHPDDGALLPVPDAQST